MSPTDKKRPAPPPATTTWFLPPLLLLFIGSGCSALIYEIVWFQLLQFVIGSSAVSLGVLLGTFMGGMCLGSLLLPRLISGRRHPLRVYAVLELGIGVFGLLILFGVPLVGRLYVEIVGHGLADILLRGAVCALCLLPPTLLMGATLPAVARSVESTPRGMSWLGFFYGGNIAGAVVGCLLAGFYLLRVHDVATAAYVAAAVNAAVALLGLGLAELAPYEQPAAAPHPQPLSPGGRGENREPLPPRGRGAGVRGAPGAWLVYVAIALSGMAALGAEVVWTRVLSLLLGGTVYTFSIILAVFLVGLGLGSSIGAFLARSGSRPRLLLGGCQLLLAAAIAWTAYMVTESLPKWPVQPSLSTSLSTSEAFWLSFQLDMVRCLWAVLPATVLWGASFPLALAAVAAPGQDPGRLTGGVYAANTAGAIVGALGSSLFLIGHKGTQVSEQVLIAVSAAAAVLALVSWLWPSRTKTQDDESGWLPILVGAPLVLVVAVLAAYQLAHTVPGIPGDLVAYGRQAAARRGEAEIKYVGEGLNSSVAVTLGDGHLNFHVSGKVEASGRPEDMRLQRMLGHLSALVHPHPRSVLIVGCGAGVTAGSFVPHPDVERIVICEIEPLVPQVVATYFAKENHNVLHDPRVEVVYDDARHFVLTTREKFDVITSDPIHPFVKGSAALYTTEYFELCKRRLNPGGVVTQWVPLYESDADTVRSEFATFFDAFPDGTVWGNTINGDGYDVVLLGQDGPTRIDLDALDKRLRGEDHAAVVQSLSDVGLGSAMELLATYGGQGPDLKPWLEGAEINRDRNLRLQYLAGMGLNYYLNVVIYKQVLAYRRFPEDVFVGSEERRQALRAWIERP
jgi:spermidine synthase